MFKMVVLASLVAAIMLVGCGVRREQEASTVNVTTTCYNGVRYFVTSGNVVGAVIDKNTLQPQRCN